MERPSTYELERIDCNCNNCGFMLRDLEKFKVWHDWHMGIEIEAFNKRVTRAALAADKIEDVHQRAAMRRKVAKMRFLFEKAKLLNYGHCRRYDKPVSFLPGTCQLETQHCFVHRKDYVHE